MAHYRLRPPTVEAVQWTGDIEAVQALFPDASTAARDTTYCLVPVMGGRGHFAVPPGHWITIDAMGAMNYLADESFQASYDELPESP